MAAGRKGELVPRPAKKVEYDIRFASSGAKKGWHDLVATMRNPMADAWDFLTRTPTSTTSICHVTCRLLVLLSTCLAVTVCDLPVPHIQPHCLPGATLSGCSLHLRDMLGDAK